MRVEGSHHGGTAVRAQRSRPRLREECGQAGVAERRVPAPEAHLLQGLGFRVGRGRHGQFSVEGVGGRYRPRRRQAQDALMLRSDSLATPIASASSSSLLLSSLALSDTAIYEP